MNQEARSAAGGTGTAAGLQPLEPREPGRFGPPTDDARPEFEWIEIEALRVDPAYQRPILERGRRTIEAIAREFSWAKFTPLVVAPVEIGEGLYFAILDGQHRATAAAERGFTKVPCWVVELDARGQAAAFAAINGQVTPMSQLAVWKAALAAGEPWALELRSIAERAGVTILTYPKPLSGMKPGETMAAGTLKGALERHGPAVVEASLAIIRTIAPMRTDALNARALHGLLLALGSSPAWLADRDRLIHAARAIRFDSLRHLNRHDAAKLVGQLLAEKLGAAPKPAKKEPRRRRQQPEKVIVREPGFIPPPRWGRPVRRREAAKGVSAADQALIDQAVADGRVTKLAPGSGLVPGWVEGRGAVHAHEGRSGPRGSGS